ncbi:disintegrin and metalloproteinase domain-containing protein 10-like [Corticium candelabrum]|uniref:disintegrin and metalloproteinase domain-containing protein 10-like n=1 Tax=Corticium candelabrum TaxID=121492 RepID=UPI002E256A2C|nr:disintegrin and metalloproteinase domain-containing protein 10-like [Corticium candelabrum]
MNRLCCTCNGAFVSSVRFIIVFTLTWAARETRGKPQERPLTTYIRHYEPLVFTQYEANPYDESMLHSRVRRSTHSNNVLRMDFTAHGRNFSLRMRPHSQLFHPNVKFESVADSGRTVIDFDPKQILTGYVQGTV